VSLETVLTASDLLLDPKRYTVSRDGHPITLSSKEFSLLEFLLRNKGQTLTKDRIIQHVWNYDSDILPNTVEVYIKNLRTKIDSAFPHKKPLILTKRGFGYLIEN
jgi:DNA-binding response OmpR family regulator